MSTSLSIVKNPTLEQSQDYYLLRRKGIEFIEQMGSRLWTDYNEHDPGITILEALCYAITDLGYRAGWDIKDILAEPPTAPSGSPDNQALYTARNILTINPLTVDDFRRILIDLDNVANAWLKCKHCGCEAVLYANCKEDSLAFEQPQGQQQVVQVAALGTYDVLLELEHDHTLGDLNDQKIRQTFTIENKSGDRFAVTAEFRLPDWDAAGWGNIGDYFIADTDKLKDNISAVALDVSLKKQAATSQPDPRRWNQWQHIYFAKIEIAFGGTKPPDPIVLADVPLRLFGADDVRRAFKRNWDENGWDFAQFKMDDLVSGIATTYLKKTLKIERALAAVKRTLHGYRNLCEDFCGLSRVCVEDVAVCADIDLKPDADIELVVAKMMLEIEQYFNPEIRFFSLQELLDEGMPVDEIFEGPQLTHGFVKTSSLEASELKSQLRTSDIINRLMEIDGVIAVKNLLLTRYGRDGRPVLGVADVQKGSDPKKMSAAWTLEIDEHCIPSLDVDNSKFQFFKNDLPFLPRLSEVHDTLHVLRGKEERMKLRDLRPEELDLSVPRGTYRSPDSYTPVQYSFPLVYGIGEAGLPETASEKRRGQASQLKAFLLFFEQLLANYFAQVANVRNLFSLEATAPHTYFVRDLRDEKLIRGVTGLMKPELDEARVQRLAESTAEYLDRRNRFLDHLMARFAESFTEYALMLYSYETLRPVAQELLIERKVEFLKALPVISRERDKGLDYRVIPQLPQHRSGLQKRISRLLGLDKAAEDHIIIVEHLLLRPKFPGDGLMDVCLGEDCSTCRGEDPYSFQLSVLMPGWMRPFDENLELRRFADRTIRLETPSHLLAKICWIGNVDYVDYLCGDVVSKVADKLESKGLTFDDACSCARKIYDGMSTLFKAWYVANTLRYLHAGFVRSELLSTFASMDRSALPCAGSLDDALWTEIKAIMADHFQEIAVSGCQFERFQAAWSKWLEANTAIEWTEERLLESVISLLSADPAAAAVPRDMVCKCAAKILAKYGQEFSRWIDSNLQEGHTIDDLTTFRRGAIARCDGIKMSDRTEKKIAEFLRVRYKKYTTVSYYLRIVLDLLSKVRNIYPGATLHDCDDGNDVNPLRLGSSALGVYSLRQSVTVSPVPEVPPVPKPLSRSETIVPDKAEAKQPVESKTSQLPKTQKRSGSTKAQKKQSRPKKRK